MKISALFIGIVVCLFNFSCTSNPTPSHTDTSNADPEKTGKTGSPGKIMHYEMFESEYLRPRNVDVWLPEGYSSEQTYSVLYMHDGQNLFNPETSYSGISWEVDVTLSELMSAGQIEPSIVVGIWNTPDRTLEYTPEKPYRLLSESELKDIHEENRPIEHPRSNEYLRFIVFELKPFIDSNFSTNQDRKHTFIAGSSMGGLISLYALAEYPDVFGGAACVSTHWPLGLKRNSEHFTLAFLKYLSKHHASFNDSKLYFDHGTETLDEWYAPHQTLVDSFFREMDLVQHQYQSKKIDGASHNEISWQTRFDDIAIFLLGNE